MRASNLSLAIATGCCLLWAVRADRGVRDQVGLPPTNVTVTPTVLVPGAAYTVNWDGCISGCEIIGVNLMEVGVITFNQVTTQSSLYQPLQTSSCDQDSLIRPCAVGTAPSVFSPSVLYEIDVSWTQGAAGPTGVISVSVSVNDSTTASSLGSPLTAGIIQSSSSPGEGPPDATATLTPMTKSSTPILFSSALPSATSSPVIQGTTSNSSSLSIGAKVGIAIGAVGFALLVLIAALLIWRRSRQRQLRALPNGMPYSHDTVSTTRDLTAEKEMNVINSPVDTLHNGYSSMPPVAQTHSPDSWAQPDEHTATGAAAATAPYTETHRGSYGSGYDDSELPIKESQPHMLPPAAGAAIQRKPVGTASGPTHHLREPGMSDEEVARLEEEERRLDEAIAEAERRRQLQG